MWVSTTVVKLTNEYNSGWFAMTLLHPALNGLLRSFSALLDSFPLRALTRWQHHVQPAKWEVSCLDSRSHRATSVSGCQSPSVSAPVEGGGKKRHLIMWMQGQNAFTLTNVALCFWNQRKFFFFLNFRCCAEKRSDREESKGEQKIHNFTAEHARLVFQREQEEISHLR